MYVILALKCLSIIINCIIKNGWLVEKLLKSLLFLFNFYLWNKKLLRFTTQIHKSIKMRFQTGKPERKNGKHKKLCAKKSVTTDWPFENREQPVLLCVGASRAGCAASADAGTACAVPWYVLNRRSSIWYLVSGILHKPNRLSDWVQQTTRAG